MKTKALFLLLLLSLSQSAFSEPPTPQWEEFCPAGYCHPDDAPKPSKLKTVGKYVLFGIALGPAGLVMPSLMSSSKDNAMTYWDRRHQQFINELRTCDDAEDKSSCYMHLRMLEAEKNAAREAHIDRVRLR